MVKLSDLPVRCVAGKQYGRASQRSISYYHNVGKGTSGRQKKLPTDTSADIDVEDLNNVRWIKKRSKVHKTVNCQLLLDIARRKIDGQSPIVESLYIELIGWLQSLTERDFVIFNLRATGEISKHKKGTEEYSKFVALGHEIVLPSSFWNDDCHPAFVRFPLC